MGQDIPDANPKVACAKCGNDMQRGFVVDQARGGPIAPTWLGGAPEYGFTGLKVSGKLRIEVVTFRCVNCGYLESYAPQAESAESGLESVQRTFQEVFPKSQ